MHHDLFVDTAGYTISDPDLGIGWLMSIIAKKVVSLCDELISPCKLSLGPDFSLSLLPPCANTDALVLS